MPFFPRARSLHTNVIQWTILPLTLVLVGIIVISALTYQNISTRLVLERHRHLANVAAVSVSQVIDGYAHVLEALASQGDIQHGSPVDRANALAGASEALDVFTAGVMIVDADGGVVQTTLDTLQSSGSAILAIGFPSGLREITAPVFSNVISVPGDNQELVLIAAPLFDQQGAPSGAIIGAFDLDHAPFSQALQRLSEPSEGYMYLVDNQGIIISHPEPGQIGEKFSDLPLMQRTATDESGEMLWISPAGDQFVAASAKVSAAGWSLIVKEPWEAVIATTRAYALVALFVSLLAVLVVSIAAWQGLKRVTIPIQKLVTQTMRLSQEMPVEPIEKSSIDEVDRLAAAFTAMTGQIAAYRDDLHRYVGAITTSQEEERLRIARELHDEIIQNLLTISRKVELLQFTEDQQEHKRLLAQLKEMTLRTTQEVRQISQDLRPMMLEDLGLVPAIRMLLHQAHEGPGAIPHVDFQVSGNADGLTAGQELALYRITQEALANVRKHACATGVLVELAFSENAVQLVILDDGKGFLVPESMANLVQRGSLGLMGIRERVWVVGGRLSITSTLEHGTKIEVTIPLGKTQNEVQ